MTQCQAGLSVSWSGPKQFSSEPVAVAVFVALIMHVAAAAVFSAESMSLPLTPDHL